MGPRRNIEAMRQVQIERWSFRAALALGFCVTLGLWLYTGYAFAARIEAVRRDSAEIASRYMRAQELLSTVRLQVLRTAVRVRDALLNPDPGAGLGTSLAVAARHALERGAGGMLVLLADMPLVSSAYVRRLAGRRAPAATRQPDGRAGVPALLDGPLIAEAAELTGDRGAAPLLRRAALLDPPPGMLQDVDTAEDRVEVERQLLARHVTGSPARLTAIRSISPSRKV